MARTRSTRKPAARSTSRKNSARTTSTRGRAAAKKTSASSRGAAKSKSGAQSSDAEFRAEVGDLLEKLTSSRRPWSLRRARQEFERSYVNHIIRRSDMDRQRAATRLDIGFSTLKEKIRAPGKR